MTQTATPPAIDYNELAKAMREGPENETDAEISGPGWDETLLSLVPARGTVPTAERASRVAMLRGGAAANAAADERENQRLAGLETDRANLEADTRAIDAYRAANRQYRANMLTNPTGKHVRPARPTLKILSSDSLAAIENSNNSGGAAWDGTVRDPAGLERMRRGF